MNKHITTPTHNTAYETTIYWVYRDNVPAFRSSNRDDVMQAASKIKLNYPQSRVTVEKRVTVEETVAVL